MSPKNNMKVICYFACSVMYETYRFPLNYTNLFGYLFAITNKLALISGNI